MAIFTWIPDFGAKVAVKPRVRVASFGDGYEQRQADGINTKGETWDLQFQNRDNTETAAILAFLQARNGTEAFDWTVPNTGTPIRAVCREWTQSMDRFDQNTVAVQFKRVYEP